jgi:protein-tyrosine-phosphatase
MKDVLFVCIHNSGRSQMAEAFFNQQTEGKANAVSAGTNPGSNVNPVVVEAMREIGIDISESKPKALTIEMVESVDRMITMGCGADAEGICPSSIIETEDWKLDDPHDQPIERVREIRDKVKERITHLIEELDI